MNRNVSGSVVGNISLPLSDFSGNPYSGSVVKRLFDVVIAIYGLAMISPILFLVACAIKIESPGPILFRQQRYGLGKRMFWIYKFRTMRVSDGSERFSQATRNDDRVTRVGAFLRRTSLDELPQLANVLMGQMALVGPRPHPTALDDQYCELIANYDMRFAVKPGMTGLAQVNGARGETPTVAHMAWRIRNDLAYVSSASFVADLRILRATVRTVLSGAQAY